MTSWLLNQVARQPERQVVSWDAITYRAAEEEAPVREPMRRYAPTLWARAFVRFLRLLRPLAGEPLEEPIPQASCLHLQFATYMMPRAQPLPIPKLTK